MNTKNLEIKDKEIGKMRIVVIVLAVLFVLALMLAGFFGFKYNDLKGDEDDDDEDDDDDFREAPPVRRRQRTETESRNYSREASRSDERGARTAQRRTEGVPQRRPASAAGTQRRPETEGRTAQRTAQTRRPETEAPRRPVQSAAGTRTRSAAPAGQVRRAPEAPEKAPVRSSSRGDVEWRSKNFLTRDEDEVSFIDMDDDV